MRKQRLYRSRGGRGRRRATVKKAETVAIQIKGPQREEKGDDKESGCERLYISRGCRGRRRPTITYRERKQWLYRSGARRETRRATIK